MKAENKYPMKGQISLFETLNPDIWCGKMLQEPSRPQDKKTEKIIEEKISKLSSRKSSESSKVTPPMFLYLKTGDGQNQAASWVSERTDSRFPWLGDYMMLSFGESPSVVKESRLSQILEENPHPKYCLSAKACQGILNRAERRGKELPSLLRETLIRQSASLISEDQESETITETTQETEQDDTSASASDKCLNPWDVQSKHIQPEEGIAETLYAGECRYGGGESYVMQGINGDVAGTLDSSYYKGCGERQGIEREVVCCGWGGYQAGYMLDRAIPDDKSVLCLNDQGGSVMDVSKDVTATLRAQEHGHQPMVVQKEPILLESNQNHATVQDNGISTTLPASMGEGGGYVPMVCIEGNGTRESHKGDGYSESEIMYTLNTVEQHGVCYSTQACGDRDNPSQSFLAEKAYTLSANPMSDRDQAVCYGICSMDSNSMKSSNPHSGIYEADTSRTIDLNGGNPACNQGGMMVVQGTDLYSGTVTGDIAATLTTRGDGATSSGPSVIVNMSSECYAVDEGAGNSSCSISENISPTLATTHSGEPAVCYGIDQQGVIAFEPGAASRVGGHIYTDDKAGTLRANAGDNQQAVVQSSWDGSQVSPTLTSSNAGGGQRMPDKNNFTCVIDSAPSMTFCGVDIYNLQETDEVGRTLTTASGGLNEHIPCVIEDVPHISSPSISMTTEMTPKVDENGVAFSLKARDYKDPQCVVDNNSTITEAVAYNGAAITCPTNRCIPQPGDPCHTLDTDSRNYVIENHPNDSRVKICEDNVFQTLSSRMGTGGNNTPMVGQNAVVRRLTPVECERLQDFPDHWTDIGEWVDSKGKKHKDADSPRYKALGNSIALPMWAWMSGKMCEQLRNSGIENPTMASLFDGIGGFPLVYLQHGCTPVWASEIEEFPIAVTKRHFGENADCSDGDYMNYIEVAGGHNINPDSSDDSAISFLERAGCEGGGKGILIQEERTGTLSTLNNQSVMQIRKE